MQIDNNILFDEVRRLLAEGHTVTMRVKGQSMRPFLEGGRDKVVLERVCNVCSNLPLRKLKRSDMVLAEISPNRYVLHRIIKIDDGRLTLMGDGNVAGTENCNITDVIGLVKSVIRNEKTINARSRNRRFYSHLWIALKPVRKYLLAIHRRIK